MLAYLHFLHSFDYFEYSKIILGLELSVTCFKDARHLPVIPGVIVIIQGQRLIHIHEKYKVNPFHMVSTCRGKKADEINFPVTVSSHSHHLRGFLWLSASQSGPLDLSPVLHVSVVSQDNLR